MAEILRLRFVTLTLCLVSCVVSSTFAEEADSKQLISQELLKASNLRTVWSNELPVKNNESLKELRILGKRIYALSNRNYLMSLNKETGKMVFGSYVTRVGFPLIGLELYEKQLLSIIGGNKLVNINPDSGVQRNSRGLNCIATSPAVRNKSFFYFGGIDNRIHVLSAENLVQIFDVSAEDDSVITSIIADDKFVIFATDTGWIINITPDKPRALWRFKAPKGIAGRMVRDGNTLFFACKDTNVYKINIRTGTLIWKYQSGGVLKREPRITPNIVYQYVPDRGVAAIEKTMGKFIWQLKQGVDLLAESKGKAYIITNAGTLAVMDNNSAKCIRTINVSNISGYAANVIDAKIYIGDKIGRITCLEPF